MREVPPRSWYDPRIELRPSPIHGIGMFAREPIAAGRIVAIVGGELLDTTEFRRRTAGLEKYNAIQVDDDLHLLGPAEELETAVLNHSCDSNLWMGDEVTIVARRDIAAGEELTIDYALFTTAEDWALEDACNCSSPLCRSTVTGRDWRSRDVQKRYEGHFSPFLNRRMLTFTQ